MNVMISEVHLIPGADLEEPSRLQPPLGDGPNSYSAGTPLRTPLGELTSLPRYLLTYLNQSNYFLVMITRNSGHQVNRFLAHRLSTAQISVRDHHDSHCFSNDNAVENK